MPDAQRPPPVPVTFALGEDGTLAHVDAVHNGLACNCRCAACGARLVAKQGSDTAHHFAHEGGSDCPGALETSLHLAAKAVLMRERRMVLPEISATADAPGESGQVYSATRTLKSKEVLFDDVNAEVSLDGVIPDIVARVRDKTLLVEIAVTHFADETKRRLLKERGLATVEIDLSAAIAGWGWETLTRAIVVATDNKAWVFNPRTDELREAAKADAIVRAYRMQQEEGAREKRLQRALEQHRRRVPGFQEAHQRLRSLIDASTLAAEQARQEAQGPGLGAWHTASRMLNIAWEAPPSFLNMPVRNELGLPVARRVWQASIFALFVRTNRNKSFSTRAVQRWCLDTFGFRSEYAVLQKHEHLLSPEEQAAVPWAAKAIRQYLDELVKLGFLKGTSRGYEIVKGHPMPTGSAITDEARPQSK